MGTHPIFESDFDCLTEMSSAEINLAATLLKINFGPELGDLVEVIGGGDYLSMRQIELRIESYSKSVVLTKHSNTSQLLATLLWHKFADFRAVKDRPVYRVNLRDVNRILQYPRYLYHIEEIFGPRGSSIIEFLLLRGQLQAPEIIDLQMEKEKCASEDERSKVLDENKAIFKNLISNRFIHKEALLKSGENVEIPVLEPSTDSAFTINFERGKKDGNPEYWSVNHTRFSHYIKDQLLVERASLSCGAFAANVLRNALRFCELGTSIETVEYGVSLIDIQKSCREANIDFADFPLDSVLELLVRSHFMSKDGAKFTVRIRDCIERMFVDSALQWIGTMYGRDARKVVALLLQGNYLEPKVIAKKCVMDNKETKRIIYLLMADGILQIQDISPSGTFVQAKYSIYLFRSDKLQLAQLFKKRTLLAQKNMTLRLTAEYEKVKSLLQKKQKHGRIQLDEGVGGADSGLLPREEEAIQKYKAAQTKLLQVLRSLEQQLLLIDMFIFYRRQRMKEALAQSK